MNTTVPVEVELVAEEKDDSVESVAYEDSVRRFPVFIISKMIPISKGSSSVKKMHHVSWS